MKPSRRAKIEMYKSVFKKYPLEIQNAIFDHRLPEVGDEVAVRLAWGEPDYVWEIDKQCRALLYAIDREEPHMVTVCGAEIDDVAPLLRDIPCAVLTASSGRAEKEKKAFARLSRDQQLDVLAQYRAPWMDAAALRLTFGAKDPKNQGLGPIREATDQGPLRTTASAPAPAPVEAPAPAPAAPEPEPAAPAPVEPAPAPEPEPKKSWSHPGPEPARYPQDYPGNEPDPKPAPNSAPAPRTTAMAHETSSVGTWSWTSTCGELDYDFQIDIGEGYRVRATARPDDDKIVRWVTRGRAIVDEEAGLQLLGFATGEREDAVLTVTLGTWPVAACDGVTSTSP